MAQGDSQASDGKDLASRELVSSTDPDSADEKRTNLREIYADVLGLIHPATPATDADIGFHFYEGLAKLVRKMQGAPGRALHQLWAAAEELRFLFDAHAVWLSVPEQNRQLPKDADPAEAIWQVATLTQAERELLVPVRDGTLSQLLERREAPGIRWDVLDSPLGQQSDSVPDNSNLAAVDSVLVIDVPATVGPPWQFAAFMEHHTPGRETSRDSARFCEAMLPANADPQRADLLRRAFARLSLPFGPAPATHRDHLGFWPVDRQRFQRESDQYQDRPSTFCELYRERFESIHTILERIYDQMNALLARERELRRADTTLIFSYRAPNDDFICFFPTVQQTRSFIGSKDDVADFLYFWQFQYRRSRAISGWVLATGTCDYTEAFDSDGRWREWINRCSDDERPGIGRQLALVQKFGSEQEFVGSRILGRFLEDHEFSLGRRHALGLQEQVAQVLVAAAPA